MKRPSNEAVVNGLALLAVVALGAWLVIATEWVDVWQRTPPRGEAARDNHYAVKQIAAKLGAKVTSPDNLDRLPPPGATLVLESGEWDFMPGRSQRLREWVERDGGHLVLPSFQMNGQNIDWVPVQEAKRKRGGALSCPVPRDDDARADEGNDKDEEHEKAVPAARPDPPSPATRRPPPDPMLVGPPEDPRSPCPTLVEGPTDDPDAPGARRFRLCNAQWMTGLEAKAPTAASWTLSGEHGVPVLRVPLGRGRVTAAGAWGLLGNHSVFNGDHAQAAVAMLDLRAGDEVWFVVDEQREALLLWLWHRAGPAIGLALLALAFALWRGALRFGPLLPQAPAVRRSVAEQIRGTAAFVWRGGGTALVAAARRALDDAARARIAGWDRMTMAERIAALQPPTALPVDLLTRALDPQLPPRQGRALADKLALLEQARRRLALNKNA